MRPTDDKELMRSVAGGDREALQVLYERHANFVFRIAYRFLFDEEEARDITQSVFVTVMQAAHRYKPEAKFTTWLFRVVVNRCLNHRSKASHRLHSAPDEHDPLENIPAPEEEQPDRILERARRMSDLRDALLQLPERQRMAVVLKRFEEMSYEEIAEALGCSKSSVESLLFRARQSLKRLIID
ncbi:MAG: sigma-70 family RNA polymerase sigma factor [Deltaproteobacteria bacterium]|nr:sigma-70 family RNA polymerase sigma factor [Deltaproteobacteria bacterium]